MQVSHTSADLLFHVMHILFIWNSLFSVLGTGKSSILLQFTDGYFNDNLQSTIGVDFKVKIIETPGPDGRNKRIKVTIWDTGILT